MKKISNICRQIGVCVFVVQASYVYSSERLLDASIATRLEQNDNVFLVSEPEGSVTSITVTPSISGIIREENWETRLNVTLGISEYTEHTLDSNYLLFNLFGRFQAQRNIFSFDASHSLVTNLSSASDDFGLARTKIERKTQSFTPTYTYLFTERSTLSLTYVYTDVDFVGEENANFTPYFLHTGVASFQYAFTEEDDVTFSFRAVDYESKDKLVNYQLFITNLGVNHAFSETLSSNFQIGVSNQNTTSLRTEIVDFFGNIIFVSREDELKNRGLIYNVDLTQLLESGSINANISRSDTTDSFGGLNQTDKFLLNYTKRVSELWQYEIHGEFSDVTSISTGSIVTDRNAFAFEAVARYSFSLDWSLSASYSRILRKFKSDISADRAPHQNKIYVGLSYNFPPLSTF